MSDDTAPVGALMAFGGPIAQNTTALRAAGWLPCNGGFYRNADFTALFHVIGTAFGGGPGYFNVPDLRGRFARGVSHGVTPARDPGAATRTASTQGGAAGDAVGSFQGSATGLPAKPFVSDAQGNHVHQVAHAPISTNDTAAALPSGHDICAGNDDFATSDSQGAHTHTLSKGGDAETRPANLYLEWCIKFRNTAS